MKPTTLRTYFQEHGEIGRIYCTPEDEEKLKKRKRKGGSKRRQYTEGWVEFLRRKDAQNVATTLNATPIGGKRKSPFYYDLWNIKYLKHFKWHNLTEEIRSQNRTREKKIKQRVAQAKREAQHFLESRDKDFQIEKIKERKQKKQSNNEDKNNDDTNED